MNFERCVDFFPVNNSSQAGKKRSRIFSVHSGTKSQTMPKPFSTFCTLIDSRDERGMLDRCPRIAPRASHIGTFCSSQRGASERERFTLMETLQIGSSVILSQMRFPIENGRCTGWGRCSRLCM